MLYIQFHVLLCVATNTYIIFYNWKEKKSAMIMSRYVVLLLLLYKLRIWTISV